MAKLYSWLVFFALCALAATATARRLRYPYLVTGKVYCDTCRFGFETPITEYLHGATVELQCMDKSDSRLVYTKQVVTDQRGNFRVRVPEDHGDQYCDMVLVRSPRPDCTIPDPGRGRSRVIVTNFNGIISNHRYSNALGFLRDEPMPVCPHLHSYYFHSDDE